MLRGTSRLLSPFLAAHLAASCATTPPPPLEEGVWTTAQDAQSLRVEAEDALHVYGEDLDRVLDSNWLARLSPDYRGARDLEGALGELLPDLGMNPEGRSADQRAWLGVVVDLARAADFQARRILKAEVTAEEIQLARDRLGRRLESSTADRPIAQRLHAAAEAVLREDDADPDVVWRRLGLSFLFTAEATLETLGESDRAGELQRFRDYLDNVRAALSR